MNEAESINREEPVTLFFETSPFGTLDAIVEHDGKAVYFYLNGARPNQKNIFGTRACWVRNLQIGPYVVNEDEMKQGIPPMMPRTQCLSRDPLPIPIPEQLSVIWFEEGNGAALIETCPETKVESTIAVIPPWSGLEGFHGYSKECGTESPLAWPLPDNPNLHERIKRADEFWRTFFDEDEPATQLATPPLVSLKGPSEADEKEASDPFSHLQKTLLQLYDQQLGKPVKGETPGQRYFAIDGGEFPPRGMAQYQSNNEVTLATVAMSLCPQPAVEIFTDDPRNWRRVELAIHLKGSYDEASLELIGGQLSHLASFPWRNFTWLGPGHTCGFGEAIANHPFVLLVHQNQFNPTSEGPIPFPEFREDPINLLWLIPISADQRKQLEDKTLTPDEIVLQNKM